MKSVLISIRPQWVEKIFHEIGWCMPSAKGKKIYEKRYETKFCCKKGAVRPPRSWCYVEGI